MMTAVLKQKIDAFHLLIETNPYIAQQKVYDFWNDVSDDPHLFFKAEPVERDALINALSRALRSDVIHPLAVSIGYQLQNHPEKSTLFTWAMMVKPLASLNETEDPSEKIAREVDLLRSTFHNWNLNQQTQSDM